MKKSIFYIFFISSIYQASAQIKVACIGNSITAGEYPKILQNLLGDTYKVEGWGQSGSKMCFSSNSAWVKLGWPGPDGIKWQQPNIITIKLGTNDAQTGTWPNCKSSFKGDYIKFIDSLYKWVKIKPQIYLCLPSPSTDDNGFSIKGSTIKNEIIPLIRQIGAELNLPIIDLNTPLISKQTEYFPDGVHPNAAGDNAIAQLIQSAILKPLAVAGTEANLLFSVHPNPANATIVVQLNELLTTTEIKIYDAIGNAVLNVSIMELKNTVDVSSLKSGVYFIKVNTQVQKLIIANAN